MEPSLQVRRMPGAILTDTRTEQRYGKAPTHLQSSSLRPKGYVEILDPTFSDNAISGETVMCMHCQFHWVIQPGSGVARGFCLRCNGPTCGKRLCETTCVPFEKALEIMERKL